jgi:Arc/MetJ-type ribon-helix-helix transcriptional regulator
MEATTVKFEDEFSTRIEKAMEKHHYATKAEFIREALREKLLSLEKQEYMMRAFKLHGAGRKKHGKITDDDLHKTREKVAREMAEELGVSLD